MNILIVKRQIPGRADLQLASVGSAEQLCRPARRLLSVRGQGGALPWRPPFLLAWGPQDLKGITCRLNVASEK